MEKRVFGRTGMQLSVLGFGCGAVGGLMVRGDPLNRERSIARAIAAGLLRHRGPIWQRRIGKEPRPHPTGTQGYWTSKGQWVSQNRPRFAGSHQRRGRPPF